MPAMTSGGPLDAATTAPILLSATRNVRRGLVTAKNWLAGDLLLAASVLVLSTIVALAVLAPFIAPYDVEAPDASARLLGPSGSHIFGTDINGMDVFSREIHAPRVDLVIALVSVSFSLAAGTILGLLGGYAVGRGGILGIAAELLHRLMDIVQSFPVFIIALALIGVAGPGVRNVILILSFLFVPVFYRFVRGEAISVRERLFVEAEYAVGNPPWRLVLLHIMPNSITPALVQGSVNMGFAVLLTAGLSFVGAGVRPPTPEWGAMVAAGAKHMITGEWWVSVFPGMAIGLTVFSLAIIGESLRVRLEK